MEHKENLSLKTDLCYVQRMRGGHRVVLVEKTNKQTLIIMHGQTLIIMHGCTG